MKADCFVRERGFSRYSAGTQTLFKVVGVSDLALWMARRAVFVEIPPAKVKRLVTGKGNATKSEVAAALSRFIAAHDYHCDDESDAAAIGVAWYLATYTRSLRGKNEMCKSLEKY